MSHTLPLKSLLPLAPVWSKTTLNTGGVVEAEQRRTLKLEKRGHIFLCPWHFALIEN